ncbi:protein trichome birefringence-like 43 [Arachis ipaensis]|uniref:protein trichome birefringence-like 43 n=1 Tax=Arachis ipaensis TaxID=130454 RepID=UPI0007AFD113|nr:protein trichome birefringence-like 43 [Arachis ipaensis]XP_025667119.1 protein trichome birefringence-like 43 [Arachis hypogaea]
MFIVLLVLLLQFFGYVNGEDELHNLKECDIYHGKWVYDDSYPLYNSSQCFHLNMHFDCQQNGRPDQQYLKYRWKPFACDLPRFSGKDLLERMRNKRITFIGDSISLNQWQSFICMLHSHHPHAAFTQDNGHGFTQFTFLNHNVSVGFSWNALLVEKESTSYGMVLNLGSISDFDANMWRHSDVLIFNSWLWWLHSGSHRPWDFIVDGDDLQKDMDRLVAYEKALSTWAHWVQNNIDFDKTLVFFRGDSPRHPNASEWGNNDGKQCSEEREPIEVREVNEYRELKKPAGEGIVERIVRKMRKPVRLLDITRLSELRKDGHPGAYASSHHQGMDCSHWCVPGVPDTWNHLFYAELIRAYV